MFICMYMRAPMPVHVLLFHAQHPALPPDPDADGTVAGEIARDVTARLGELALASVQRFGHAASRPVVDHWEARTGRSLVLAALGAGGTAAPTPGRPPGAGAGAGGGAGGGAAPPPKRDALRDTLLSFLG